jgi:predicted RNA-binding protein YlxR (DUF448 family)
VVTVGEDRLMRVSDVKTGEIVMELKHNKPLRAVASSQNYIAIGAEADVLLYDVNEEKVVR